MVGHGITKCRCGRVLRQCRCMGPHTVTIVDQYDRCKGRRPEPEMCSVSAGDATDGIASSKPEGS